MQKHIISVCLILCLPQYLYSDSELAGSRIQIETIRSGILPLQVTTGSGNATKLNFKKLYKNKAKSDNIYIVNKETKRTVRYYRSLKNAMIADLADQDPKIFRPDDNRYWTIANKRGFFFNISSIICNHNL
jgi:hypothetical protein